MVRYFQRCWEFSTFFLQRKIKQYLVVAGKNNSIVFACRSFMQCSKQHLLKHLSRRDFQMNHLKHDRIHDPRCAHSFSTSFKSQHTKSISPIHRIWTNNTNAASTAKENQRNYTVCHRGDMQLQLAFQLLFRFKTKLIWFF